MTGSYSNNLGWLALAVGIVTIVGLIFLAVFFIIGQPWGSLNDAFIGLQAILSAILMWQLNRYFKTQTSWLSLAGLIIAGIGALVATVGSVLVISGVTGYVLAGHYMNLGFSLIGLCLLIFNAFARQTGDLPRSLAIFGLVVGAVMVIGLVDGFGIVRGLDTYDGAPWFLNILGYIGFFGWGILYPVWSIWLGRLALAGK